VSRRGEQEPRRDRLVERVPSVAGGENLGCSRASEADGGGERDRRRPRVSSSVCELDEAAGWSSGESEVGAAKVGEGAVSVKDAVGAGEGDSGISGVGGVVGRSGEAERCREEEALARGLSAAREGMPRV